MKRKGFLAILTAMAMIGSMGVCVYAADDAASTEDVLADYTGKADYKIGFSQCTLASPFYVTMKEVAEDYAKQLGVDFVCVSADDDVTKQNNDINDMISSGIDALILNPINAEGVAPAIEACQKADIPVITVDRNVNDGNTAYVGKILEIQGTAGDTVMMARRDGFEAAIAEAPGLEVIQSAYCDYTRSKAVTAAQDLLQSNDGIVAVYGHNDDMSLGAAQVLEEKGIEGVKVTGVDGLMEAVMAIQDGKYSITTMNDPGSLLKVAMNTTLKVLNGEDYDEFVDAGTGVIDSSNVADYVDDSLAFAAMK